MFAANPRLRGYVLDERGQLRKHVTIFVDDAPIRDRTTLTDAIDPETEVFVLQALSGGEREDLTRRTLVTQSLWVATRKGLFLLRAEDHWTVGTPHFLGDPVVNVLDDGRDGTVYASLNLGHFGTKLQRSRDRGNTWEECAVPSLRRT